MKIVYLVPVQFQLLVLECYHENCLPVWFRLLVLEWSVIMKILYLVPVRFQLLVLECYNKNYLPSTCPVLDVGGEVL